MCVVPNPASSYKRVFRLSEESWPGLKSLGSFEGRDALSKTDMAERGRPRFRLSVSVFPRIVSRVASALDRAAFGSRAGVRILREKWSGRRGIESALPPRRLSGFRHSRKALPYNDFRRSIRDVE